MALNPKADAEMEEEVELVGAEEREEEGSGAVVVEEEEEEILGSGTEMGANWAARGEVMFGAFDLVVRGRQVDSQGEAT